MRRNLIALCGAGYCASFEPAPSRGHGFGSSELAVLWRAPWEIRTFVNEQPTGAVACIRFSNVSDEVFDFRSFLNITERQQ